MRRSAETPLRAKAQRQTQRVGEAGTSPRWVNAKSSHQAAPSDSALYLRDFALTAGFRMKSAGWSFLGVMSENAGQSPCDYQSKPKSIGHSRTFGQQRDNLASRELTKSAGRNAAVPLAAMGGQDLEGTFCKPREPRF